MAARPLLSPVVLSPFRVLTGIGAFIDGVINGGVQRTLHSDRGEEDDALAGEQPGVGSRGHELVVFGYGDNHRPAWPRHLSDAPIHDRRRCADGDLEEVVAVEGFGRLVETRRRVGFGELGGQRAQLSLAGSEPIRSLTACSTLRRVIQPRRYFSSGERTGSPNRP